MKNKRKNTRSQVWSDTKATLKVTEDYGSGEKNHLIITGTVQNLGSNGLFLETDEIVPVPARSEIIIDFAPEFTFAALKVRATGETVHLAKDGIGIRFTSIDLNKLQRCIIAKMNMLEKEARQ